MNLLLYVGLAGSLAFSICLFIAFLLLISEFMETIEIIWICLANLTTANYDSTRIRITTDLNRNICGVMAYFISYLDLICGGWTCLILYVYYRQVVLSICFRKSCFCSSDGPNSSSFLVTIWSFNHVQIMLGIVLGMGGGFAPTTCTGKSTSH